MSKHEQFLSTRLGSRMNEPGFGYECVALAKAYNRDVHGIQQGRWGDAIGGWRNTFNAFKEEDWVRVENVWGDLNNIPKQGDVVFYENGSVGHVGICNTATGTYIDLFEQNGGAGSSTGKGNDAIRIERKSYVGCYGRYTPKINGDDQEKIDQAMLDEAKRLGVWNGDDPNLLVTRSQAVLIAMRAIQFTKSD